MGKRGRWEYFKAIYQRYRQASAADKSRILDEFCKVCGYNRKYAIWKLNGPVPEDPDVRPRKRRANKYSERVIQLLAKVWEASGYPCSIRLKALLPLWLPWMRQQFYISTKFEKEILSISARQMDRRLSRRKVKLKRRLYGRTKPGTLLKHHIPLRTEHWNVRQPGFTEADLVSHSGNYADGQFAHSLNQTDVLTGWVETRAVLGKSEKGIVTAMEDMRQHFPFPILGIDSDNGSEFINYQLYDYCQLRKIQFTRGRPYKKDDNAHIEQKNWTHVRKLIGWDRYDSATAVSKLNDLYKNELRLMMNLFLPSMKLQKKMRIGSRLVKIYDQPKTPLDRVIQSRQGLPLKVKQLFQLRYKLNPFQLTKIIEAKLQAIYLTANRAHSPNSKILAKLSQKRFPRLYFVSKERVKRGYSL